MIDGPGLCDVFAIGDALIIIIWCGGGQCLITAQKIASLFGVNDFVVGAVAQRFDSLHERLAVSRFVIWLQEAGGIGHLGKSLHQRFVGGQLGQRIARLSLVAHEFGSFGCGIAHGLLQGCVRLLRFGQFEDLGIGVGRAADGGRPRAAHDTALFLLLIGCGVGSRGVGGAVDYQFGRISGQFVGRGETHVRLGRVVASRFFLKEIAGRGLVKGETAAVNGFAAVLVVGHHGHHGIGGFAYYFHLERSAVNLLRIIAIRGLAYGDEWECARPSARVGQVVGKDIGESLTEVGGKADAHAAIRPVHLGKRRPCQGIFHAPFVRNKIGRLCDVGCKRLAFHDAQVNVAAVVERVLAHGNAELV